MRKVLVIEDEAPLRKAMCKMLSSSSFEVFEASDGKAGLMAAFQHKPDVILLDLLMPNLDGHAMLDKLRMDAWGKTVKVIVLSNQDDAANISEAYDSGITEYIVKSNVSLDELKKMVKASVVSAS